MTNKEKIAALAETYTDTVIQFYRDKRNSGITPTNSEILAACSLPTNLGNVENEAALIIFTVTQLVDADMNTAPKAENTVKSSDEWQRRRARLAEIETKATEARRQARIKELRADNEAQARQKAADLKMAEHLEQSRQRQAVAAERAKLDVQLAAQQKLRMQSFPIPRG
ncbi:hypothetical protein ADU59_07735 [Pararhizobium polonicum]|uniref:Uncharacterized protein n=1 Tax=Pararhizobium polonicum TaxID=1612624 RepID=A0A1C7P8Z4_9HYPH|nr:hypothetical protein [Pararhizobium polonicum]OBZ96234.1 hypothetical protein ADU59_07735 [Pararhizobium polonicum]